MGIDEPGQQRPTGQVDRAGMRMIASELAGVTDGDHGRSVDDHGLGPRRTADAGEHRTPEVPRRSGHVVTPDRRGHAPVHQSAQTMITGWSASLPHRSTSVSSANRSVPSTACDTFPMNTITR